ncbi:MAG TPA: hypothetical protein PL051_02690 [Candidatus Saccharibacteria bacterium]|nr:hypothetical protein [Candidatus Saccharibacteria bacterium]
MLKDRPSQRKVVGVSYRYLKGVERTKAAEIDRWRLRNEEITGIDEATTIGYSILGAAVAGIVTRPMQSLRAGFLEHVRDAIEGKRPGEENLAVFALNKLSKQEQKRFPNTLRDSSTN